MLVLTRKAGDRILIGDDIVITVLDSRGDGVRIGIAAPSGVPIHRAELKEAVEEANTDAAAAAAAVDTADAVRAIAARRASDTTNGSAASGDD